MKITQDQLNEILEKHKKWLNDEEGGERADLSFADLSDADLSNAKNIPFIPMACPNSGSFIGYKKARIYDRLVIVKLEITEDAKRSSSTGRKCRCSKAKVLAIENFDGTEASATECCSICDKSFKYTVGEVVEVSDFDDNRWEECTRGIHFFINRQEAVEYDYR